MGMNFMRLLSHMKQGIVEQPFSSLLLLTIKLIVYVYDDSLLHWYQGGCHTGKYTSYETRPCELGFENFNSVIIFLTCHTASTSKVMIAPEQHASTRTSWIGRAFLCVLRTSIPECKHTLWKLVDAFYKTFTLQDENIHAIKFSDLVRNG